MLAALKEVLNIPDAISISYRKTNACTSGKVFVVLGFYVPTTAKVIRRRDLGLKSHPKDWRSPGSNSRHLVYKASSVTTTPLRLLSGKVGVLEIESCVYLASDINPLQYVYEIARL